MQANLIIYQSTDGTKWDPVKPDDVPDWLKDEDTMAHLVAGETAQRQGEAVQYAAMHINPPEAGEDTH